MAIGSASGAGSVTAEAAEEHNGVGAGIVLARRAVEAAAEALGAGAEAAEAGGGCKNFCQPPATSMGSGS